MDFSKFDLNLFKVFAKVMETGSYADASEALDVSPPAISLAMGRLQKTLGAELFTRGSSTVQPTAAAIALYDHIRTELLTFESVINSFDTFDPASSTKQFSICIPEEFHTLLLQELPSSNNSNLTHSLLEQVQNESHGISLLRNRSIDLVIDSFVLDDKSLQHELLFEDDIVIVVANSHSHSKTGLSLQDYQTLPQSVLSLRRNNNLALELFFNKRLEIKRNIVNEASSMLANMMVVSGTQLFCHTTRSLAERYQQTLGLSILAAPIELKRIPFYMQWHKTNTSSPAHLWLRERVRALLKT
ncbi:LysR family transcriptional regulator [Vibrio mediterranei]|uniref:LysR family transcriptional regulator n=1 Tax=Vibrio mediterranei TaxID=689 RepID=UPI00148D1C63|nr:LysR family transcriptional regulator [Vibrio mediterranei]NOI24515.1 LysR family transcriptional regulator [Vibrio mediterranei]